MIRLFNKRWLLCLVCWLVVQSPSLAQDTTRITLPAAEAMFLQRNLTLLAERYNIGIAQAQVIQARLYNNPTLGFSGNIYNPDLKKPFDLSDRTGQYGATIQQIIILAGKRNKQVTLAKTSASMAQNNFFDLLRTLRYTLRRDFYKAYYQLNAIGAYKVQIASLERLDTAYNTLAARGVVTLKDAIRIRSLLYSLKAEQAGLVNEFNEVQAALQLLLQRNDTVFIPEPDASNTTPAVSSLNIRTLIDTAYANRYDLKQTLDSMQYSRQYLSLQRSLAMPDLTVGAEFDKRGNFVENGTFFNLGMDLPIFHRNQGNIRAAAIAVEQTKARLDIREQTVQNEVQLAYRNALNAERMLQTIDPAFRGQSEQLLKNVTQNFERRNLSLLEFTDFYSAYKENVLQLNRLQNGRMQALEDLNYAIGKTVINP